MGAKSRISPTRSGFPVKFVYPSVSTIVPANIGIVANAPNRGGAEAFVEFLLALKAVTKTVHDVEAALAKKDNPAARKLVADARDLIAAMPVSAAQASSPDLRAAFTGGKQKGARQAEVEQQWATFGRDRYAQARAKVEEAAKLAR
jgi:ABC-type Fe3+ transport system substrate-binding protein